MSEKKAQANGSANNRKHDDGSSTRAFTVEQKAAVLRVRKCKTTDFYDILGLEQTRSTCSESEIKKAYRKLSLLTHPDKNGYPGADEAFKMVSRAFQILSDSDKKAKYDQFGGDPDNRFASGSSASGASPFSGFASQRSPGQHGRAGAMFEEEISPEELFRRFFGGGMGGPFGGGLGGGNGFVFNMGGGPGIRLHQFGGDRPRRRPHNHENIPPQSSLRALQSLLPLLLLFILPLISSLFGGDGSAAKGPSVRFDSPVPPQTQLRTSSRLQLAYWVDPVAVKEYSPKEWKALDQSAERRYVGQLSAECEWEQGKRQRLMQEAQGFFFTDHEKLQEAAQMQMPSCQKLRSYGYQLPGYGAY